MKSGKVLTIPIMDPPYESATTTTSLRLIDCAIRQGHDVTVFAYEGAVSLSMKAQQPHANPVKGTSVEQEQHPTTKDWVAALFALGRQHGTKLDWINCGLCVDERGAGDWIDGPRRGGPKDFYDAAASSTAVLVVPTR